MQYPPLHASAMFANRNLRLASESKTGELLRALEECCFPHRQVEEAATPRAGS